MNDNPILLFLVVVGTILTIEAAQRLARRIAVTIPVSALLPPLVLTVRLVIVAVAAIRIVSAVDQVTRAVAYLTMVGP